MKTFKLKLDNLEIMGETLHRAFRQYVDSKAGAIAHNVVDLMEDDWEEYLRMVQKSLNGLAGTKEELRYSMETISVSNWKPTTTAGNILHIAFDLFTNEDWNGYCAELFEVTSVLTVSHKEVVK